MNMLPRIPNLNASTGQLRFVKTIGRILLVLTALLIITMPATQHFWSWDHFLRGGHDYELGTLILLSLVSLAIVLAKHGKQYMDSLFAVCARLRFICHDSGSTGTSEWAFSSSRPLCAFHATVECYRLPLQI